MSFEVCWGDLRWGRRGHDRTEPDPPSPNRRPICWSARLAKGPLASSRGHGCCPAPCHDTRCPLDRCDAGRSGGVARARPARKGGLCRERRRVRRHRSARRRRRRGDGRTNDRLARGAERDRRWTDGDHRPHRHRRRAARLHGVAARCRGDGRRGKGRRADEPRRARRAGGARGRLRSARRPGAPPAGW